MVVTLYSEKDDVVGSEGVTGVLKEAGDDLGVSFAVRHVERLGKVVASCNIQC